MTKKDALKNQKLIIAGLVIKFSEAMLTGDIGSLFSIYISLECAKAQYEAIATQPENPQFATGGIVINGNRKDV